MWENDDFGGMAFHICEGSGAVLGDITNASGQWTGYQYTDTHVFLTRFTSLKGNCAGGTHLD